MVLNKYRNSAERILIPFAKALSGLSPNSLSAASVAFALLAGIAFTFANRSIIEDRFNPGHYIYIMFIIASVCIFLNGFLDAIDGKVARLTNRMSKQGDFLDHALDRYADVLILGGIMLSPYCNTVIGALAIIAVFLTSYMGTQAQALGCGRDYSGLLGRADRMAILIFAPVIQMGILYYYPTGRIPVQYIENFTILEYIMLWFFIAGNITAIHRGVRSWRELQDISEPSKSHNYRAQTFYEGLSKNVNEHIQKKPSIEPVKDIEQKKIVKQLKVTKPLKKLKTAKTRTKTKIKTRTKTLKKSMVTEYDIEWDERKKLKKRKVVHK